MAQKASTSDTTKSMFLAAAMFVLVVDTSLMNVSIAAIVESLGTTVSGVQSAIALEALISASFILINSKVGDIIGRKRAYILGLCGYAAGALAMAFATDLTAIIFFWAILGGLGAALLLPAMQSLIHGNFEGVAQRKAYALVGAASGIAIAVGPLLGGFIGTFLSYRIAFLMEFVVIIIILFGSRMLQDEKYTGPRKIDIIGAILSVLGMGGVVLGVLAWQEGGERVGLYIGIGVIALVLFAWWIVKREREKKLVLLDPKLFHFPHFRLGFSGQMMQNIVLGSAMIAIPIFLQISLEYNSLLTGLSIAPMSLSLFFMALIAGKKLNSIRPSKIIKYGFGLTALGMIVLLPIIPNAESGWSLFIPMLIVGTGLGLLVSQLNNYTLAPIDGKRVSEAAGVNSAAGNFGLSFGLAIAGGIMLAALSYNFTNMTNVSTIIPNAEKQPIAAKLDESAQVVSRSQLDAAIASQPADVEQEILNINEAATYKALQVALLIPTFAAFIGLAVAFKMEQLPDIKPSADIEGPILG